MSDVTLILMQPPNPAWSWFPDARFGMFIHWGPYACLGRGEQVLIRELADQRAYAQRACAWRPCAFDPRAWASTARQAGCRYAVLTTRHHDGFCMWDSRLTDYTSARQAAGCDVVRGFVDACRAEGLRVGLYYSLADWRIPAYFAGPRRDPQGWARFRDYVHGQVAELLSDYGEIAEFWFDGAWPRNAQAWRSRELIAMMRRLQPGILINNRLDSRDPDALPPPPGQIEAAGESRVLGDFGTPEHHTTADPDRLWEACHTSTWRLWGYAPGERWRDAPQILDLLTDAAAKGGNLLLNVGPDADGVLPAPFVREMARVGRWMEVHGACIRSSTGGTDVAESVTWGRIIRTGDSLFLVVRFWDGSGELVVHGLGTPVRAATLMGSEVALNVTQDADHVVVRGLPRTPPGDLFPVIRLDCVGAPTATPRYGALWNGDPMRYHTWSAARGTSVWSDGRERPRTATLPAGTRRLLILGDSITHAGGWVAAVATYLATRHPDQQVEIINAALPSETVSGLSEDGHAGGAFPRPCLHERLARALEQTRPDMVIACYGMNDGIYLPYDAQRFAAFTSGMGALHDAVTAIGAVIVHLSPPCYDARGGGCVGYDAVMARYAAWLCAQRTEAGWDVVDVHGPMHAELVRRRSADPAFVFAADGVHADEQGHWVIAREVLLHLGAEDLAGISTLPALVAGHPHGSEICSLARERYELWRDAWLSAIGHQRPGMAVGLPLAEARRHADRIASALERITRTAT